MNDQLKHGRREFLWAGASVATSLLLPGEQFRNRALAKVDTLQGVEGPTADRIRKRVQAMMSRFKIPGLSLAMAKDGQLKLLGGFGMADKEAQERVEPDHRFRVASVSKPITSIAIMKLVEQGKLGLQDQVLGQGGILNQYWPKAPSAQQAGWLKSLSVQHLLEHLGGGWSNRRNDPMFVRGAIKLDHAGLIQWTLDNQPLENRPGTKYAYSNFGYCLLGRVIEAITKETYEAAVQSLVLDPAGIKAMQIGKRTLAERAENEVRYYGQNEDPYHAVMRVDRMDSHGGWIATPRDLVRLVVHVDGFDSPEDILSKQSTERMSTASKVNPNYAKGWSVNRSNNWWHGGSFNGGTSIMARIHDNMAWAVVVNTRPRDPDYTAALDKLPWQIRSEVKNWPEHDLFGAGE